VRISDPTAGVVVPPAGARRANKRGSMAQAADFGQVKALADQAKDLADKKKKEKECSELCSQMSTRYNMTYDDVMQKILAFNEFDANKNGKLDKSEFQDAIRAIINLPGDGPLPKHLFSSHWLTTDKNNDGLIDFEEFLQWSAQTAYVEEVLVPDPQDRLVRRIARDNGVNIQDAERLKEAFDHFDADSSGLIELNEFRHVLYELLGVKTESDISGKKLERWWREIDTDGSGSATFEEFLTWYITNFRV